MTVNNIVLVNSTYFVSFWHYCSVIAPPRVGHWRPLHINFSSSRFYLLLFSLLLFFSVLFSFLLFPSVMSSSFFSSSLLFTLFLFPSLLFSFFHFSSLFSRSMQSSIIVNWRKSSQMSLMQKRIALR